MANSDKNILITPQVGGTSNPTIVFTGADNNPVTMRVLDDGTLSIEGSSGQLFSVSDSLTGTIFSVNDISGIPSIEVFSDGTVKLAEFGGNVGIGTTSPSDTLDINGTLNVRDHIDFSDTTPDAANRVAIYPHGYELYVDNAGAGENNTRLWLNAPKEGEVVIGPRGGSSTLGNMRIRSDDISLEGNTYVTSGNVGIGTTSPSTKVDVYTDAAAGALYPLTLSAKNSSGTKKDYVRVGFGIEQGAAGIEAGGFRVQTLRNGAIANAIGFTGATNAQTWDLYTEGVSRMRIDPSGRVTTPYQPAFYAHVSGSNPFFGAGWTVVPFNGELFDSNGNFNTSTYRFVAPVGGKYQVNTTINAYNIDVSQGGSQFTFSLYKNGVEHTRFYMSGQYTLSTNDRNRSGSTVVSMSANDYLEIRVYSPDTGFNMSAGQIWTSFSGFLIG